MSFKEFLGGVRVLQPTAANLRDPPLWVFLTPSHTLIEDHEKQIFDEFQQLDEEGFIPHRKLDC